MVSQLACYVKGGHFFVVALLSFLESYVQYTLEKSLVVIGQELWAAKNAYYTHAH